MFVGRLCNPLLTILTFLLFFLFRTEKNLQKKDLGNKMICIEQWLRILIMNAKRRQHQQKI